MTNTKPKIVEIEWVDAQCVDNGLLNIEDVINTFQPVRAYIIGFLICDDIDNYYLAKEWWESSQCKYLHIIPKRSVIALKELRGEKK
jgi:hypothetical protein